MNFEGVKLGDVVEEITVGHVGPMASEYVASGIPFLRSQNVLPFTISTNDIRYITSAFHAQLKKSRLRPGDVVIVRTGKPGTCAVIPEWLEEANCSDLVIVRCGKRAHPRYIAYWVNSLAANHISGHLVGAVQQHFNVGAARQMPMLLPAFDDQLRILEVLGSLDNKIELNRRMNETLEAMAQAIFLDWFIDFGPTRRKLDGATHPVEIMGGLATEPDRARELAGLFPGRFGDDGLPEGWKEGTLGDVARAGGTAVSPSEIAPDTPYIGLEHMPRRSIALGEWEAASKVSSNKTAFRRGQILFGKLRPYFHKVGIAPVDGVSSTDIIVLDAINGHTRSMIAACVSTDEFVRFTDQGSTGTKMPRTSWGNMKRYLIALPPDGVIERYSAVASPLMEKIVANVHESRTLATARDLLLPKLMSGEIRLREVESLVEEVA